jgi:hypothetical protein
VCGFGKNVVQYRGAWSDSQIDHEMWMWWVEAYKCQA